MSQDWEALWQIRLKILLAIAQASLRPRNLSKGCIIDASGLGVALVGGRGCMKVQPLQLLALGPSGPSGSGPGGGGRLRINRTLLVLALGLRRLFPPRSN